MKKTNSQTHIPYIEENRVKYAKNGDEKNDNVNNNNNNNNESEISGFSITKIRENSSKKNNNNNKK